MAADAPYDPFFDPRPRRRGRRLLLIFLLVPVLAGFFAAPAAPVARADELAQAKAQQKALQDKIAKQQAQIKQLNQAQSDLKDDIATTTNQLQGIAQDLSAVRKQVATIQVKIEQVQARYNDLVAQIGDLDTQLTEVVNQEAQKKVELGQRLDELATRIREAYEADRTSMLETVLSSASFADVLQQMSYQLDIAEQDRALAQRIQQDRDTLAALEQTVQETRDQTNLLRQEAAAQKRELDARLIDLKAAQARLKQLEADTKKALSTQRAAFAKLQRDKANLKRALAEAASAKRKLASKIHDLIQQQLSHGNIPSKYNGTLNWPMPGTISQDFGCTGVVWEPPNGSCPHYHNGIDIVAPCNTPVKAAGPGSIVYIGWNYADGPDPAWIVIVAHSGNLQTWYAHMAARYPGGIHAGSSVKAGQVIGYEASTGHSTGCHLHWMVEYDGNFVNPRLFT